LKYCKAIFQKKSEMVAAPRDMAAVLRDKWLRHVIWQLCCVIGGCAT